MSRHLSRMALDDSSDKSVLSLQGANSPRVLHEGPAVKDVSRSTKNIEMNIREVSQVFEDMSIVEEDESRKASERSLRSSSRMTDDSSRNESSASHSTYLEDSFIVKESDNDASWHSKQSSFECSEISELDALPPCTMELRSRANKFMESTPVREKPTSKFSNSEKLDPAKSLAEHSDLLLELYPELRDHSLIIPKAADKSPLQRISLTETSEKNGDDSEESFEKYIRKLKEEKGDSNSTSTSDDDDFVVSDEESLSEELSEKEEHSEESLSAATSHSDIISPKEMSNVVDDHSESEKENELLHFVPRNEKGENRNERVDVLKDSGKTRKAAEENERERIECSDEELFLLALSSNGYKHAKADFYLQQKFAKIREELTQKLFLIYRKSCFDEKLDREMKIFWNVRLTKTAGRCKCKKDGSASIELSPKVCNSPDRIRDTLLHEMCHAAVWVIDKIRFGCHGPAWKYWAIKCTKVFPHLPPIERCHNYEITAKFLYICDGCGQTIKRHSKSLNTKKKICGICRGHFILHSAKGKVIDDKKRANKFALYVKEYYGKVKKDGLKHGDVMKILSERFKQHVAENVVLEKEDAGKGD